MPLTSTAAPNPADAATDIYAGDADARLFDVPNDKSPVAPALLLLSILSRSGAGVGTSSLRTSLKRSIGTPIDVEVVKSV